MKTCLSNVIYWVITSKVTDVLSLSKSQKYNFAKYSHKRGYSEDILSAATS